MDVSHLLLAYVDADHQVTTAAGSDLDRTCIIQDPINSVSIETTETPTLFSLQVEHNLE